MAAIGSVVQALDEFGVYEPRGPLGVVLLAIGAVGVFAAIAIGLVEIERADDAESP